MRTHLFREPVSPHSFRDRTACGLIVEGEWTSWEPADVTCKRCRRTLAWWDVLLEQQSPRLQRLADIHRQVYPHDRAAPMPPQRERYRLQRQLESTTRAMSWELRIPKSDAWELVRRTRSRQEAAP